MLKNLKVISIFCLITTHILSAHEESKDSNFEAFTGSVTKNHVRMRILPDLDSSIVKELDKEDLVIVVGKNEDFYAIKPPANVKAYVYRTYVFDNKVEGHHVNVRTEPHMQAPIIAQLNSGDTIEGQISSLNSKWLEISIPKDTHFYVAMEYIEKIGGENYMVTVQRRRNEVNDLLNTSYSASQTEMQKPFPQIDLTHVFRNYSKIIDEYQDFPEQAGRSKKLQNQLQEKYLEKKIAYLEALAGDKQTVVQKEESSSKYLQTTQQDYSNFSLNDMDAFTEWWWENSPHGLSGKMSLWVPAEKIQYETWLQQYPDRSIDDFYAEQKEKSIEIRGIIEPYERQIRNKPGDYVLLHKLTRIPIAYVYSSQIDLNRYIGHEVTIRGVLRPNNNFAYPAYFVLDVD